MNSSAQLQEALRAIHRKSYPAYKSLKGVYQFDRYLLSIDHVQGDPFASPSHISVRIQHKDAGFPEEYYNKKVNRITLCDHLTRLFEQQVSHFTFRAKGSGQKRTDLCHALRPGNPGEDRLRDHGKGDHRPVFHRLSRQRTHHQRPGTGKNTL